MTCVHWRNTDVLLARRLQLSLLNARDLTFTLATMPALLTCPASQARAFYTCWAHRGGLGEAGSSCAMSAFATVCAPTAPTAVRACPRVKMPQPCCWLRCGVHRRVRLHARLHGGWLVKRARHLRSQVAGEAERH